MNKNKLSIFSNAMYKKESLKYINKKLGGGWNLDKQNSKVDSKVFVKDNIIVIAFRGTVNLKDVKDDISIITSREHLNKRWKRARNLITKMNEKYKDGYKIFVTGHSLAANIAEFATRHTSNETIGFSRGNLKIGQKIKNPNYKDVYNKYDPISTLVGTHKGKSKQVKTKKLNKHSMMNFV